MPELADLAGFDGSPLVGFSLPPGWAPGVAGARDVVAGRVGVDERWRVAVPIGVRRRLGLASSVVVSVALDATQVVARRTG